MAREINSHGVKYAGIYTRELPWKLTAPALLLWLSGSDRKRELAGIARGGGGGGFSPIRSFLETFLELLDLVDTISRNEKKGSMEKIFSTNYLWKKISFVYMLLKRIANTVNWDSHISSLMMIVVFILSTRTISWTRTFTHR